MTMLEAEPGLADLAAHEAVIQRGLDTFMDVGLALVAIKANRLYRHAGYATFDAYCDERWSIGSSHRARLMVAAVTAEQLLDSSPIGELLRPEREAQVRPLTMLDSDDDRREAWAEAVSAAGGAQPTAAAVEAAVARRRPVPEPTEEEKKREEIGRRAHRLELVCSGWHEFRELRANPRRDEILAALAESDRQILAVIETEITWKT